LAAITKPADINKIWAASGDVLAPPDSYIANGWSANTIPPRQYFNYIDGRQDQAIAHINQYGVALWDSITSYQANSSYTQGSDGVVYKCLITNTNINPVGDTTSSWRVAFVDSTSALGPNVATAAQSRAMTDNTVFISPLQLANAFTGSQQVSNSNGKQILPGGIQLKWGQVSAVGSTTTALNFDVAFTSAVFQLLLTPQLTAGNQYAVGQATRTTTGFTVWNPNPVVITVNYLAIGV